MVTHVDEVFPPGLLAEMVEGGYVRMRSHPDLPLELYSYTEKTQHERVWNACTRACRGLIVNTETGEVVARPFPKFFNWDEPDAPVLDPAEPCVVSDKVDGSLGIVYPTPGGPVVATRGSFFSPQAAHATVVLRTRYPGWSPPEGFTALVEIVYPANRIVVDYGDRDDLVWLGLVEIASGASGTSPWISARLAQWPGPVAESFPYRSLTEALAAPPRPGREGLVVHAWAPDVRVKIKQADYVALHKIITGFTARGVWLRCAVRHSVDEGIPVSRVASVLRADEREVAAIAAEPPGWLRRLEESTPPGFADWARSTAYGLTAKTVNLVTRAEVLAASVAGLGRGEAAARLREEPLKALAFLVMDGRSPVAAAWRMVFPPHELPFAGAGVE